MGPPHEGSYHEQMLLPRSYISLQHRQRTKPHKKHSETDFSSDSDYDELANEIPFVGDILQQFQL